MKKLFYFLPALLLSALYSCSDNENIDLKESETTLFSGQQYAIKAKSDTKITYNSNDEFIATVSDKGIVSAETIGETTIVLDNSIDNKSFKVKVKPKYDLYSVPDLSFGMTKSDLIKKYGTPDGEDEEMNTISYEGYSVPAPIVMFTFDKEDKLIASSVAVLTSYSQDILPFLDERYKYIGEDEEAFLYIDAATEKEAKTYVIAEVVNIDYWIVGYMPVKSEKADAYKNQQMSFKKIGKAIKKASK